MARSVEHCIFCGSSAIKVEIDHQGFIVACDVCGAIFSVEFLPPSDLQIVASVELIRAPHESRTD
jgi:hypothetical protein